MLRSGVFVAKRSDHVDERPDYAVRFTRTPCCLCNSGATESLYHLIFDCTHHSMDLVRLVICATFPHLLQTVWRSGLEALSSGRSAIAALPSEVQQLLDLTTGVQSLDLTRDWHRFLVYWMVTGTTWPRYVTVARPAEFAVAAALGALFDGLNVRPGSLNQMITEWLAWSETTLRLIAARRLEALPSP